MQHIRIGRTDLEIFSCAQLDPLEIWHYDISETQPAESAPEISGNEVNKSLQTKKRDVLRLMSGLVWEICTLHDILNEWNIKNAIHLFSSDDSSDNSKEIYDSCHLSGMFSRSELLSVSVRNTLIKNHLSFTDKWGLRKNGWQISKHDTVPTQNVHMISTWKRNLSSIAATVR